MNNLIGFFDSGIGGLNVLAYCNERLKGYKLLYYGDNKNAPYGNKSKQEIEILAEKGIQKLVKKGCKIVVIACNTVSTNCINDLRKKFPDTVFITTTPSVPKVYSSKKTLVLCTSATEKAISNKLNCDCLGIKDLAGDIENNIFNLNAVNLNTHLDGLRKNYDLIYLGCTHYIFVEKELKNVFSNAKIDNGLAKVYRKLNLAIKNASRQGFMTTKNQTRKIFRKNCKNCSNYIVFLGKNKKRNLVVFTRLGL